MSKIYVNDRNGKCHELNAKEGMKLMEIIRDAGLDIEAACGGCCACATCHVYIEGEWTNKLPRINEEEESMLDQAFYVQKNSRLSCQIDYLNEYEGITLTLAKE